MPEESKKNQKKGKNEPKDQRRRRQGRQPPGPAEKEPEKQTEVPTAPEKPSYEPPGPEFYKNLKRETEEILKITEEANTKYKKKEIQSNWAKYEMPVETYEEIDEQESMGADYEKLIQAPMQTGGHFQFKHEKSWDSETGPSQYDKYFNINMDRLSIALSTIPFYERNGIDKLIFNENDVETMNHRATKFKQKYYNDKKYTTPELEAQDKILKGLSHNENPETHKEEDTIVFSKNNDVCEKIEGANDNTVSKKSLDIKDSTNAVDKNIEKNTMEYREKVIPSASEPVREIMDTKEIDKIDLSSDDNNLIDTIQNLDHDDTLFQNDSSHKENVNKEPDIMFANIKPSNERIVEEVKPNEHEEVKENPKNSVIESPEDLEKWLDDFLDD